MIQWTTGDDFGGIGGLGGIPARVGFFHRGEGFIPVPGSGTDAIINIDTTSNVDMPGVWVFCMNGENVTTTGCGVQSEGKSKLLPHWWRLECN